MNDARLVQIEIHGQRYPIRTTLPTEYVQQLAAFVDHKLDLAAAASPSSDTLGLAVLAALNIADELFRARDEGAETNTVLAARTTALEQIVDRALALAEQAD
ncbi:MAG: cell division protein ZapA [Acidobacteriota bacterium]